LLRALLDEYLRKEFGFVGEALFDTKEEDAAG